MKVTKELVNVKFQLNSIKDDLLATYGINNTGRWIYTPTNNTTYFDLIVNNRLGKFVYKLHNSEGKINFYIKRDNCIYLEDEVKLDSIELPREVGKLSIIEFINLKDFILESISSTEIEEFLNKDEDINLKALYGSKCSINTIKNIQIVEESLKNNQITIYDMKDFYEKCYQVRNFENKEVQWTFRLKLDDGKGNLLTTTYINVFFIGKTPERIVVVCKDIVIEQEYILNLEVGNVAESLSEQWKEIYEL
jgi:hypothetical protein